MTLKSRIHFSRRTKDKIYIEIPPGYEKNLKAHTVCKLKQSRQAWFDRFRTVMIVVGYRQSQRDCTLFIKHSS